MLAEACLRRLLVPHPVRPIYRSYPVYHPDHEPAGYMEWMRAREPAPVWDASKLRTREDWIQAGELVFEAPIAYGGIGAGPAHEEFYTRSRSWYERVRPPLTKDGELPLLRYVVREKGKVEIGVFACAMSHTRVLPDGSALKAGPGNFPFDEVFAEYIETGATQLRWSASWLSLSTLSHGRPPDSRQSYRSWMRKA